MRKQTEDWQTLQMYRRSLEVGSLFRTREKLELKIEELVLSLASFMKSEEGLKFIVHDKKSHLSEDEDGWCGLSDVKGTVKEGFVHAITQFPGYEGFCKWAKVTVTKEARGLLDELAVLSGTVGSRLPDVLPLDLIIVDDLKDVGEKVEKALPAIVASLFLLPVNWPGLLAGLISAAVQMDSAFDRVVAAITPSVWVVHGLQTSMFWKGVKKGYAAAVGKACENNCKVLRDMVMKLLQEAVEPVQIMFREIPSRILGLEEQLKARVKQESQHLPGYGALLAKQQNMKAKLTTQMVQLWAHEFDMTEVESLDESNYRRGCFGPVYKTKVAGRHCVALEIPEGYISDTSNQVFRMLLTRYVETYYMFSN